MLQELCEFIKLWSSGTQPTPYSMSMRGSFLDSKVACVQSWLLTSIKH